MFIPEALVTAVLYSIIFYYMVTGECSTPFRASRSYTQGSTYQIGKLDLEWSLSWYRDSSEKWRWCSTPWAICSAFQMGEIVWLSSYLIFSIPFIASYIVKQL